VDFWLMVGYGKSDKPFGTSTHIEYSKRVMADDMIQLMYVPVLLLVEFSSSLGLTCRNRQVLIIGTN